ncbi:MAG: hypothetical protein KF709_08280 [Gemmatimonadaceae bacterium]|nr:hypothetical protein [Gemmatimonadaceae bacterium]
MPRIRSIGRAALLLAALSLPAGAQARPTDGYHTSARLTAALDSIARAKSSLVRVTTIATSPGRRPVQVVRLGGNEERPALLILAGAYGPQISSSEVALRIVRDLARRHGNDAAITEMLSRNTVYVMPRINPDATEAFFTTLRTERTGNDTASDEDRDHAIDEDAPDDLNGDGLITMMRVKAPNGVWIPDAVDPALMRRADATKGERGIYRLLVEGRDNDGDDDYNEDGPGGTDISRNFANDYRFFSEHAGLHPFSADESRAVAEFVSTHDHIAAVYVLGMQDNLLKPWEGRRVAGIAGAPQGTSAGGPFSSPLPDDNGWFAEVSKRFKATTGWSDGPASAAEQGDPLSWSYFHMGRFAFGSRVWWPGKAPADTAAARKAPSPDPIAAERNEYRWMKANRPAGFVEWTPVSGYTIDGESVEVGGFAPFATLNPPGNELDSLASKHTAFVVQLAGMLPSVTAQRIKVTELGPRVYRITADVQNDGFLPSNAAIGVRSRLPLRIRAELTLGNQQSIQSGRRIEYINALRGSGASQTLEWVVVGAAGSTLQLTVGSPHAGLSTQTITLRAR